jgi:ribosomal protein L22
MSTPDQGRPEQPSRAEAEGDLPDKVPLEGGGPGDARRPEPGEQADAVVADRVAEVTGDDDDTDVEEAEEAGRAEDAEEEAEDEGEGATSPPAVSRARRRRASETTPPPRRDRPTRRVPDATTEVRAHARFVRTAPRKARLVIDNIRGREVGEARAILTNTPRGAAVDVLKLLNSAVANAENNHELVADDLKVGRAFVDEGPTLKRYRPRALGRATQIRKRTSHMTITLTAKE